MLQIHNSMTGRKEPFKPIRAGEVRMYVCGITVYDYCHIGHGRMLVVFDLLRRHLRAFIAVHAGKGAVQRRQCAEETVPLRGGRGRKSQQQDEE